MASLLLRFSEKDPPTDYLSLYWVDQWTSFPLLTTVKTFTWLPQVYSSRGDCSAAIDTCWSYTTLDVINITKCWRHGKPAPRPIGTSGSTRVPDVLVYCSLTSLTSDASSCRSMIVWLFSGSRDGWIVFLDTFRLLHWSFLSICKTDGKGLYRKTVEKALAAGKMFSLNVTSRTNCI